MKADYEHLGVKIPKTLNDKIIQAINQGEYVSKSDLVRTALRKLFEEANNG